MTQHTMPRLSSEAVAEELRVLLLRRHLRQADLAQLVGENEMWVSRRLRGRQPFTVDELQRIAEALGVDALELVRAAVRLNGGNADPTSARRPSDRRPVGRASTPTGPGRTRRVGTRT